MPNSRRSHRARWYSSLVLVVVYLVVGIAYTFPDEFVRSPNPSRRTTQNSVVVFIENLTAVPVWGIAFLVAGVLIALSLLFAERTGEKYIPYALLVGGVIFTMYSFASWATAIINENTYIATATLATGLTAITFVLMYNYSHARTGLVATEDPPKTVRR